MGSSRSLVGRRFSQNMRIIECSIYTNVTGCNRIREPFASSVSWVSTDVPRFASRRHGLQMPEGCGILHSRLSFVPASMCLTRVLGEFAIWLALMLATLGGNVPPSLRVSWVTVDGGPIRLHPLAIRRPNSPFKLLNSCEPRQCVREFAQGRP